MAVSTKAKAKVVFSLSSGGNMLVGWIHEMRYIAYFYTPEKNTRIGHCCGKIVEVRNSLEDVVKYGGKKWGFW